MKLLMVGGGAREHAFVWKLAAERDVSEIVCAPGNAGIARLARCVRVRPDDVTALAELAEHEQVDFTLVGPELPLARGLVDRFADRGLLAFGPTRDASQLECSKVFAKEFMSRHQIPTARYRVCDSPACARDVLEREEFGYPVVVKADGLAAGKGVTVASDRATALAAAHAAMIDRRFGDAGARIVIEEHLVGEEASFFVISDGERALPLGSAQDHKRAFDGDAGPNTGGMGAFAPSSLVDEVVERRVMREIVQPVLAGLRQEGREYRGFLYVGLMLTREGPRVVEFNVRFGDPEAQVVIPALESDLMPLLLSAAGGSLERASCRMRPEPHVGVVLASAGYPDKYETGKPIEGLDQAELTPDVLVFHAGTARRDGHVVTDGGRVLTVVGRGRDFEEAISRAYAGVEKISFEGKQVRTDIGKKALRVPRLQWPTFKSSF